MSTPTFDYAAIIADLEAKKAAIEAMIAAARSAWSLGILGAGQAGEIPPGAASTPSYSMAGGEVPAGAFLGKSIPEAARLYLEIVKRKQTSREISDALKKGGIESTSDNFVSIVHAILDRARKVPNASLVKIGTQWGLSGWYPKGILNNVAAATPSKKTKKKPKKTKKNNVMSSETKEEIASTAQQDKTAEAPGPRVQIAELLQNFPAQEFSAESLAEKFGQHLQVTRMVLGKLVQAGMIRKTDSGGYQATATAIN